LTLAHCAALDEGRRAKVFQATTCTLQRLAASFGARASMLKNNKNNLINEKSLYLLISEKNLLP
jgi:hypothetical protein